MIGICYQSILYSKLIRLSLHIFREFFVNYRTSPPANTVRKRALLLFFKAFLEFVIGINVTLEGEHLMCRHKKTSVSA